MLNKILVALGITVIVACIYCVININRSLHYKSVGTAIYLEDEKIIDRTLEVGNNFKVRVLIAPYKSSYANKLTWIRHAELIWPSGEISALETFAKMPNEKDLVDIINSVPNQ